MYNKDAAKAFDELLHNKKLSEIFDKLDTLDTQIAIIYRLIGRIEAHDDELGNLIKSLKSFQTIHTVETSQKGAIRLDEAQKVNDDAELDELNDVLIALKDFVLRTARKENANHFELNAMTEAARIFITVCTGEKLC